MPHQMLKGMVSFRPDDVQVKKKQGESHNLHFFLHLLTCQMLGDLHRARIALLPESSSSLCLRIYSTSSPGGCWESKLASGGKFWPQNLPKAPFFGLKSFELLISPKKHGNNFFSTLAWCVWALNPASWIPVQWTPACARLHHTLCWEKQQGTSKIRNAKLCKQG